MISNMRSGLSQIMKNGTISIPSRDILSQNIDAVLKLSDLVVTSFGPDGLNKIVVNHLEKTIITSDSATILKEVDVKHPAAKMVLMAALMQEKEIGDGSNLVIIFTAELCKIAKDLLNDGVEINDIIAGINLCSQKIPSILNDLEIKLPETENILEKFSRYIRTAISSKIPDYADHFTPLIASACQSASSRLDDQKTFIVDDVRVCLVPGGGLRDSQIVRGLVLEGTLQCADSIKKTKLSTNKKIKIDSTNPSNEKLIELNNVRVAVFNGSVDTQTTETKGVILINKADQLLNFNADEETRLSETISQLSQQGVNVVLTGGKVGEMASHYLEKEGIAALSVTSKFDLRRVVKLTRSRAIPTFGGEISKEDLGHCQRVSVTQIGAKKFVIFEQDDDSKLATIIIRGSSLNVMTNAEKAVDDGVNAIKTAQKDGRVVCGGGASEMAIAASLRRDCLGNIASEASDFGVEVYCKALEIVPTMLSRSAGCNSYDIVSKLFLSHAKGPSDLGVDIKKKSIADMKVKEVYDLSATKQNALRLSADVVCDILLVDHLIMSKPAGGPKFKKNDNWDDD